MERPEGAVLSKRLAINGGPKTIIAAIAGWPQYGQSEKELLLKALEGSESCASQARAVGYTIRFEKEFAAFHHRKFGAACFNCTQGLEAVLAIAGVGPGDEVLVPSYTFFATASAVLRTGAVPVFTDINPQTMCLDLQQLEALVNEKTRAVIPVHFGGYIDDMKRLQRWAEKHNILIIEDAAQAHGSCRHGEYAGAFGAGAVFSFQRNKNMCAGEGGIFLTDHEDLAEKFREFIWHGVKHGGPEGHHLISSNLRITEFQSAILLGQLAKLPDQNRKRMTACDALDRAMEGIEGFQPLKNEPIDVHSRYLYIFKIDPTYWGEIPKQRVIEALNAEGVVCGGGYPYPLYRNPVLENQNYSEFYRRANREALAAGRLDFRKVYLPQVEKACQEVMIIPHFVFLSEFDVAAQIAEALDKVAQNRGELT